VQRTGKTAVLLVCLFALPFGGLGVFLFLQGWHRAAAGEPQAWVVLGAGAFFALIGAGLLTAVALGMGKLKRVNRLQAEHPAEPWLWREDWAAGRLASSTGSTVIGAWIFAIFWNTISFITVFLIPVAQYQRDPKTFVALLFPAVGIGLLVWAVRASLARMKFGKTFLELATVPGVIGRELRGTIQTRLSPVPETGVRLKLTCVQRTTQRGGNDRSTSERIVWRTEKAVAAGEVCSGPLGTSIPVAFHLPLDARPTDTSEAYTQLVWLLEANAAVPGVDYKDVFEVPVFRTKDTPDREELGSVFASGVAAERPSHSQITVRPAGDGGTEFYFPAARNVGFAAGMTAFAGIWTGAVVFMVQLGAPFFFPLVFGLFDLLFVVIVVQVWLGTSRVVVKAGSVRVQRGLLGSGAVREFSAAEIAGIRTAITAQQGGSTGTLYYTVQLVTTSGRTYALGDNLRDQQEAEWLAAEMTRCAGLQPKAMAAAAGADPIAELNRLFRK
jgi:hypothetical protein